MITTIRNFLFVIFMAFLLLPIATADDQDAVINSDSDSILRADGGWTELTIGPNDLVAGAGTDLASTYESISDATLIDIHKTKKDDEWRLDIRRSDNVWNGDLKLYARLTGNGNGNGSINGGHSYIEIIDVDQELFSGRGLLNNIPLQYQITGISLQVPPDTYSTTIIFTLIEQ